jgi:hypothetical protein
MHDKINTPTPRSRPATMSRWRQELWRDAVVIVTLAGGEILASDLARRLGLHPKGLPHLIRADAHFMVRMRRGEKHDVMYVSLNPEQIATPPPLPRLVWECPASKLPSRRPPERRPLLA